jgi:hypothetical protein
MPAGNWYYTVSGERRGPVSEAELRQMAAKGSLTPTELVWTDGMKDWTPAAQVSGLFAAAVPMATVVPDAAPAAGEPPMATVVGTPPAAPPPTPTARLASSAVAAEAKAAMSSTWAAFRKLAVDPLGNLKQTYDMLGPATALRVGIVFGMFYVAVCLWGAYRAHHGIDAMTLGEAVKSILCSVAYAGTLAVALMLARMMAHGRGSFDGHLFTASVALIPISLSMLIGSFLGVGDVESIISSLVSTTATAMMVLVLYYHLRDMVGMASKLAIYAVPASMVLAMIVSNLIGRMHLS